MIRTLEVVKQGQGKAECCVGHGVLALSPLSKRRSSLLKDDQLIKSQHPHHPGFTPT